MIDLFEHPELIPDNVHTILEESSQCTSSSYENCAELVAKLNTIGYTCDYGLDAEPYNLHKI